MKKTTKIISWTVRVLAAVIMLQTLYFKFTAAPESVYIFSQLGMEPWGRIGVGVSELVASVLLLLPATAWLGGAAGFGLMSGAVFFHFTSLGIEVQGDGGQLFYYALAVLICSVLVVALHRDEMKTFITKKVLRKA
ncbi:MAG: DoxX family protein [Bacteroidetes bacterium]|nr:MAG: DoxX family protein [Bacteroidota bacterium]